LSILGDVPLDALAEVGSSVLVEAIRRLRDGQVVREGGYDGEYGVIRLFDPAELTADTGTLFDLAPAPATATTSAGAGTSAGTAAGTASGRRGSRRRRTVLADPDATNGRAAPASETVARAVTPDPDPDPNAGTALSPGGTSVLDGLDPDQRAAAAVAGGPLLVVAGPGTGKTRTLVTSIAHRIADLGVPAESCLAVTFTRRAAGELAERLAAMVPGAPETASGVTATTFHGLGLAIVREQHARLGRSAALAVADDAVRADILREAYSGTVSGQAGLRRAAREISEIKRASALGRAGQAGHLGQAGHAGNTDGHPAEDAYARYAAALAERDLVDLDDLLTAPVVLLREDPALAGEYRRRFAHVWVDEYQDVDEVQYTLLRLLCPPEGNLCAIGDPDQAIYSFRGADVGFFLRFREDYPGARTVSLSRSYRSTPTIVDAALAAVAPVTLVPGRELRATTAAADGDVPVVVHRAANEAAEAAAVVDVIEDALGGTSFHALDSGIDGTATGRLSFSDIAVLYRTARQAVPVMDALSRHGLPFQRRSHDRLLDIPVVAWLLAAVRAQAEGATGRRSVSGALRDAAALALDRLDGVNLPGVELLGVGSGEGGDTKPEGAGNGTAADAVPTSRAEIRLAVDALAPLAAEAADDLDAFLTATALGAEVDTLDPRADRISLLTLHAAKGLEFPLVIIVGCEDGLLPLRWGSAEVDEAEERRLAFVGMTRARSRLVLTGAARRRRGGQLVECRPAPFVADLPARLVEHRPGADAGRPRRPTMGRQLRLA
jgi:superfamily I DNA/RNA helicase